MGDGIVWSMRVQRAVKVQHQPGCHALAAAPPAIHNCSWDRGWWVPIEELELCGCVGVWVAEMVEKGGGGFGFPWLWMVSSRGEEEGFEIITETKDGIGSDRIWQLA